MSLIESVIIKVAELAHGLSDGATAGVTGLARIVTLEQITEVPGGYCNNRLRGR
jgi:hypothetical protein